jgi:hypothetical protein
LRYHARIVSVVVADVFKKDEKMLKIKIHDRTYSNRSFITFSFYAAALEGKKYAFHN